MNIFILTGEPFPFGTAGTNRILSHCKGIAELGHYVKVLCLRPTETNGAESLNTAPKGKYENVEFEYTSGRTVWPDNKISKVYRLIKGLYNAVRNLYQSKSRHQNTVILLYSNDGYYMLFFFLISRFLNIIYVQEKSEYPFVLNNKSCIGKIYARIYVDYFYKLFDGMIIMTNPLIDYFKLLVRRDARILHVPMTVEPERFLSDGNKNANSNYVAYCGNMSGNKDGVPILIEAFGLIADKYPKLKLYLIGPSNDLDEYRSLVAEVNNLGLKEKVVFTGKISREEMPTYLSNAKILALARPSGLQAAGGFPTKLGEYLCTGNPVVITSVGEIPLYLKHRIHAFICEPDDPQAFADQIDVVLSDPEFAVQVGQQGKTLALQTFDYRVQAKRMVEFFNGFFD